MLNSYFLSQCIFVLCRVFWEVCAVGSLRWCTDTWQEVTCSWRTLRVCFTHPPLQPLLCVCLSVTLSAHKRRENLLVIHIYDARLKCAINAFPAYVNVKRRVMTTPIYSHCASAGRQYMKEVLVDGQSHLMIIREETELPGAQVGWKLIELDKSGQIVQLDVVSSLLSSCSCYSPASSFSSVCKLAGCSYLGLQFGKWGQLPGSLQNLPPARSPPACFWDTFRSSRHSG